MLYTRGEDNEEVRRRCFPGLTEALWAVEGCRLISAAGALTLLLRRLSEVQPAGAKKVENVDRGGETGQTHSIRGETETWTHPDARLETCPSRFYSGTLGSCTPLPSGPVSTPPKPSFPTSSGRDLIGQPAVTG